jgi:hypothetical protein
MAFEASPETTVAIRPVRGDALWLIPDIPLTAISETADAAERSHWKAPLFSCADDYTWWLAFCCPFVLCSKTHWRLGRVARGQDPLNSSWKCSNAINPVCAIGVALYLLTGISFRMLFFSPQEFLPAFTKADTC